MTTTTSRRALLKAAPIIAAAAAVPATALTIPTSGDRSEWNAAFDAYNAAKTEDDAFNAVFSDLHDRWTAATEAVPHQTFRPDVYSGRFQPVSTADRIFVADARRTIRDLAEGKRRHDPLPELEQHTELCREVAAAADERDAKISQISQRMGYDQAETKWDALGGRVSDAENALLATPAPDVAALRWKLDRLTVDVREHEVSLPAWTAEYLSQTLADIARLLPEGR